MIRKERRPTYEIPAPPEPRNLHQNAATKNSSTAWVTTKAEELTRLIAKISASCQNAINEASQQPKGLLVAATGVCSTAVYAKREL